MGKAAAELSETGLDLIERKLFLQPRHYVAGQAFTLGFRGGL
jgi:hypothetical protein